MSRGQATARATLYPALFVDKPGDYRHGDTIAYVNRAEYLPLFEAASDLLAALVQIRDGAYDNAHDPKAASRIAAEVIRKVGIPV